MTVALGTGEPHLGSLETTVMQSSMGFFARLWLAFVLPWIVLFNGRPAMRVQRARSGLDTRKDDAPTSAATETSLSAVKIIDAAPAAAAPDASPAMQLLAIMQREGRFIDFLQEDVASFSDAQVGAAARVVHAGCKRALADYVTLEPVRREPEGAAIVLDRGFDSGRTRLTGNVVGEPPFKGKLTHHGWQIATIKLPTLVSGHDPKVIAPAEVEL
jgi:hypothetical protein